MMYKIGDIVIVNSRLFQITGVKDENKGFYKARIGVTGKLPDGQWFCSFKAKNVEYYFREQSITGEYFHGFDQIVKTLGNTKVESPSICKLLLIACRRCCRKSKLASVSIDKLDLAQE